MVDNCSVFEFRLFRVAAQKKSISAAAKIFCMSQSAASTAIQRLEKALSVPLLEHGRNKFQLTSYGHQFLECLERLELIVEEINALKKNPQKGPWRLALSHSLAVAMLPLILKRLESKFPGIEIILKIGHALTIVESVECGDIDIGLIIEQNVPLTCVRTPIYKGTYNLYGNTPLEPTAPVLIDKVKQESIELASRYEARWKKQLNISMDIPSWEVIASLTASGLGAGFLPNLMKISHPQLHLLDWDLSPIFYAVTALTRHPVADFGLEAIVHEMRNAFDGLHFHI